LTVGSDKVIVQLCRMQQKKCRLFPSKTTNLFKLPAVGERGDEVSQFVLWAL